jgi:hypothetical protein
VLRQWSLFTADRFPRPVVSSLLNARLATQADVTLSHDFAVQMLKSSCFPPRSGVSVHPLHRLAVPESMASYLTFIMAIGLLAAERLDHLNGTCTRVARSILMHHLCLDSLPSAEVFEGLPTGWNFTPRIGFFWHRAHALLALFSIFDNLLVSWQ